MVIRYGWQQDMGTKPFNILLVEDDATDAMLIQRALERGGVVADFSVVQSRREYLQALDKPSVDIVISDSSVLNLAPIDALSLVGAQHPNASFIVLSGVINHQHAKSIREAGALACLEKNDLSKLIPIVHHTLERKALPQLSPQEQASSAQKLIIEKFSALRLVQAVKELSAARDVPTIQAIVRRAARELNGADGATFVLRDNEQCYYADEDAIAPLWKGQRFPLSACISGWAMLNRKEAVVEDIEYDDRIPLDAYRPTFVRSLVMVPIRTEAPIGAIGNYWATRHAATPEEINVIQALADATSIALENVQVYQELEQRVASRTAELKDLNAALEEFSYFVSHDLRAPLRHIHAFSDILKEETEGSLSLEANGALKLIKTSATNMGELLDGLLTLAKSGKQSLKTTVIDMNALVASVVQQVSNSAKHSAKFNIGHLPAAIGDKLLLQQAWLNLIGNAVKYSSGVEASEVDIGYTTSTLNEPCYFVRDNGVGFDMNEARQLFTAFRRLESGRGFAGTGVGLAIVHRIIGRHDGRIWAESSRGKGATFYFTLPGSVN
jgi:signal transduction histidine kinase